MNRDKPNGQIEKSDKSCDRQTLIDHLNNDLAGELQAICMYIQYSSMLRGANRKDLRELFQAEIPDEQGHAQLLSDKISIFGGVPHMEPRPVPEAQDAREMLQNVLEAEEQAIADYMERAKEAEDCGEIGLKVELEDVIVDETKHRDEVKLILSGWCDDSANGGGRTEHASAVAH